MADNVNEYAIADSMVRAVLPEIQHSDLPYSVCVLVDRMDERELAKAVERMPQHNYERLLTALVARDVDLAKEFASDMTPTAATAESSKAP